VADLEEIGERVRAVEGERDHLPPALGFADGAAVLHEGEGDAVALAMEMQRLVERPLPGVVALVVAQAQQQRQFLRAHGGGRAIRLARQVRFRRRGSADGAFAGDGRLEACASSAR
jgi:hypothetical protein